MRSKIQTFFRILKIVRSGRYVGDAAALKLTLFGVREGQSSFRHDVLAHEEEQFERIELDELKELPLGSLGREYFEFITQNKISPLNFSETTRPIFKKYPVSVRYIRVHDLIHVLLGFDTSVAGEVGVYEFIYQQNYCKTLQKAAQTSFVVSNLFFWLRSKVKNARQRARALAQGAKPLINFPFEQNWSRSLKEIREELSIRT